MLRDACGLTVSTSSRAAVDAYDRGARALLGSGAETVDEFRRAVDADPDFVLARAALAVALYLDEQIAPARAEMERAMVDGTAQAAGLTGRERRHLLGDDEWRRVHGNDERISLENLTEGVRCHTEMLLDVAAA